MEFENKNNEFLANDLEKGFVLQSSKNSSLDFRDLRDQIAIALFLALRSWKGDLSSPGSWHAFKPWVLHQSAFCISSLSTYESLLFTKSLKYAWNKAFLLNNLLISRPTTFTTFFETFTALLVCKKETIFFWQSAPLIKLQGKTCVSMIICVLWRHKRPWNWKTHSIHVDVDCGGL